MWDRPPGLSRTLRVRSSFEIGLLRFPSCAVKYVEHFNMLLSGQDAIYHTVDGRLVAVQQVSELGVLACRGAAVRLLLQAENGLTESPVPFQSGIGMRGVDCLIQVSKVAPAFFICPTGRAPAHPWRVTRKVSKVFV
jgi:hypothetical protein